MNVKGDHNHEVNIKRNKPLTHMLRQRPYRSSQIDDLKVELLDEQYHDYIIEEDEEQI